MPIQVQGQYRLRFKLGSIEDFITNDDLIEFTIIEEAGNQLPTFKLDFYCYSEEVLRRMNETNTLEVSFGKDESEMYDASLYVTRMESAKHGPGKRLIAATGLVGSLEYLNNPQIFVHPESSGVELIAEVANKYFNIDIDPGASDDSQVWLQPNISDKLFINHLWMHSYLADGFIGVGISSDETFILRNLKEKAGQPFDWKFTSQPQGDNEIAYDPDAMLITNTGFMNHLVGYGREHLEIQLETGDSGMISEEARPILALTDDIARKANMEKKFKTSILKTTNVHENFWKAHQKNFTNLMTLGNVKVVLSYTGLFRRTRVLDLVMYTDEDLSDRDQKSAAEYHSGLYFISKVARTFSSKQLCTVVEMVRESLNRITGDVLATEPEVEEV